MSKLKDWEVELLHQAGYGTHTEIRAREEFQDDDDYAEKPKRKGKPINWREVATWTLVILSIALGMVVLLAPLIIAAPAVVTAMNNLQAAVFPYGVPRAPREFEIVAAVCGVNMGIGMAIYIVTRLIEMLE